MNQKTARRSTWVVITLVLFLGAGVYFHFRTQAGVTIGSDTPSFQADLKNTLNLQAGVGGPTFTRATTATVTDFEGIIRTVKSGEARFEGARRVENLASQSETFSTWTPFTATIGSVNITNPIGGSNSIKLTATASVGSIYRNNIPKQGTLVSASMYVKAGTASVFLIQMTSNGFGRAVTFDLSSGTAGAVVNGFAGANGITGGSASITPVGNGWYRCSLYNVNDALSTVSHPVFSVSGNVGDYVYIWGGASGKWSVYFRICFNQCSLLSLSRCECRWGEVFYY